MDSLYIVCLLYETSPYKLCGRTVPFCVESISYYRLELLFFCVTTGDLSESWLATFSFTLVSHNGHNHYCPSYSGHSYVIFVTFSRAHAAPVVKKSCVEFFKHILTANRSYVDSLAAHDLLLRPPEFCCVFISSRLISKSLPTCISKSCLVFKLITV